LTQQPRVYWKTSKKVVVQRYGLTSDRKTAPSPPAPPHPRQSQYMWTLKMGKPTIRTQEHRITCAAEDTRFNELLYAFLGTLIPPAVSSNRTSSQKSRKKFDGPRSPLPQGECATFNARLHGKHGDQAAQLLSASVDPRTFLWHEHAHRLV